MRVCIGGQAGRRGAGDENDKEQTIKIMPSARGEISSPLVTGHVNIHTLSILSQRAKSF